MDINSIEQEEIRPLIFNYIFHFLLFILIFILHIIVLFKIYWTSLIFNKLYIFGMYFGIIYFLFPIFPILFICLKNFKLKKIILFKKLSLILFIISLIIGLLISIIILINTLNSKLFCQECPFNISLEHLNYIFNSYYDHNPSLDEIKDKCKSKRCILDSEKLNEEYPYDYLCNYDPSSDFEEGEYKRNLPDGREISVNNQLICSDITTSYSSIVFAHGELPKYLRLCYYATEFYYCRRFNKPSKIYELDIDISCPDTSYLFLLYILCALIIIIDIIIAMLPWAVEYISLKRIIQILRSGRRKPNSNNSTAKSSVASEVGESFKKERTLILVSPLNNENNNIINIKNKNNNKDDNNLSNQLNNNINQNTGEIILGSSERVGLKDNLARNQANNNQNYNSINVLLSNNQNEENIVTDSNQNQNTNNNDNKIEIYNDKNN